MQGTKTTTKIMAVFSLIPSIHLWATYEFVCLVFGFSLDNVSENCDSVKIKTCLLCNKSSSRVSF